MDIFRDIGNFFKGAFGGDSEEEKRRKRQQQKSAPKPVQKSQAQQVTDLFGVKKKPTQAINQEKPQLQTPKAPVVAPPKTAPPRITEKPIKIGDFLYSKNVDGTFTETKSGAKRTAQQLKELDSAQKVYEARDRKIKTDQYVGNLLAPVTAAKQVVVEPILRIPETVIRSGAELVDPQGDYSQRDKNTGFRKFWYGEDPVSTYQKQGDEADKAIKDFTGGKVDLPAPLLALALVGLDVGGVGIAAASKNVVKGLVKGEGKELISGMLGKGAAKANGEAASKRVIEKLEKDAGRKLTDDEANKVTDRVNEEINKTLAGDTTEVVDTADDISSAQQKLVQHEADVAESASKQADATQNPIAKSPEQYQKDIDRIVAQEEDNLTRYVNENPDLTPQQIEAARETATQRVTQLTKELEANRAATVGVVDNQAKAIQESAQTQAKAIGEVEANKVAAITPAEGDRVQVPAGAAVEVRANNAYNSDAVNTELDSMTGRIGDTTERTTNPIMRMFGDVRRETTDRYRAGVDEVRDRANDLVYDKTIGSNNELNAKPLAAFRTLFDKAGMKDVDRLKVNSFGAGKGANAARVKAHARDIEDMFAKVDDPAESAKRLYQVFEEPDMLARMYGEGTQKLSPDMLAPAERQIFDRLVELNKVRNKVNRQITIEKHKAGLIPDDEFAARMVDFDSPKSQAGLHSPRIYDIDFKELGIAVKGGNSNKGAFMGRQDVAELPQDVIDSINANPAQSMLFRLQTGMDELARIDAIKKLEQAGYVRDFAPNKNWTKLEGPQYGAANGKYMDNQIVSELENKQIFTSNAGQKTNDLLDIYRNSWFGTLDRAVKRAKTSYSPGTFIGNLFSNPLFFNRGSGVNSAQQAYNMAKNVPDLVAHTKGTKLDPDILEMQRHGIKFGNTTDELVGSKQNLRVLDDTGRLTSVKDMAMLPNKIYAGADDLAKVSIFKTLKKRGMDSETAALRVSQFTQDYGNAGRAVQMLADSPVLGNPFARFVPELLRLTKNNLLYNPVGTFAGLYGLAALQQKLFKDSGETEEERALRESAPGKVKIPFSSWVNGMVGGKGDISLDFPVGDSAVNAARALGFNFPQEPGVDAETSLLKNLAPFAIPFMKDPNDQMNFEWQQMVSSMLFKPLAEQLANKDFMGRTVDDPTNRVRDELPGADQTKYTDNVSDEAKMNNRLYHLFMNWFPLSGEADAAASNTGVRDALTKPGVNDMGKDYYGKDRTGAEAVWRALGFKVESNDKKARETRKDTTDYYENEKPIVDAFLNENPNLADSYWKIRSTTRDRYTDVSANDIISPEKYKIIAADTTGRLFDFFKAQAMRESKEKGTALDPIYTLPPDQANQVIRLKGMYTGDDVKFQQLLYKEDWFNGYKEADRKFQTSKPEFKDYPGQAKPNARPEEWYKLSEQLYADEGVKSQFPLVKQYQDTIAKFADYNSDERKAFTKNWYATYGDNYDAQKGAYEAARLDIVNKMRAIEGAPPMSPEVWTGQFKTDEDSSGYGKSYGSGGGGGGSNKTTNTLGELTSFSNDIKGYDPIEAAAMPELQKIFAALQAGKGSGKTKPKLGASSSGT